MTRAVSRPRCGVLLRPRRRAGCTLSLVVVAMVAACRPETPSLSDVPLAINYEWPPPPGPWDKATATVDPSAVVLRWRPGRFSARDIQAIASQQCGLFHRAARASGPPVASSPLFSQRFACVAEDAGKPSSQ